MYKNAISIVCLMLFLSLLSGCATVRHSGADLSQAKIAQLVEGQTTKQQALTLFGKPTSRTRQPNGSSILVWTHTKLEMTHQLLYLPTSNDILSCTFDSNGILQSYMLTTSDFMRTQWETM